MSFAECDQKTCIHNKDCYCTLKQPEKTGKCCLDFEDTMDFLRLKADAVRGTLG